MVGGSLFLLFCKTFFHTFATGTVFSNINMLTLLNFMLTFSLSLMSFIGLADRLAQEIEHLTLKTCFFDHFNGRSY